MSTAIKTSDRDQALDELQRYYEEKLNEVHSKRGYQTLDRPRQLLIGGSLNLTIDPEHKTLTLSWNA